MAKDSALSALNGLKEGHGLKTEIVSPPKPSKKKLTSKVSISSSKPVYKSKKGTPGRKPIADKDKRVQMTLTLAPETKRRLEEWAESKPRSATNYLSDYVEEHLDDIMK